VGAGEKFCIVSWGQRLMCVLSLPGEMQLGMGDMQRAPMIGVKKLFCLKGLQIRKKSALSFSGENRAISSL
jgi:hypothetical protein